MLIKNEHLFFSRRDCYFYFVNPIIYFSYLSITCLSESITAAVSIGLMLYLTESEYQRERFSRQSIVFSVHFGFSFRNVSYRSCSSGVCVKNRMPVIISTKPQIFFTPFIANIIHNPNVINTAVKIIRHSVKKFIITIYL